jgi:hypothetical protein
MADLIIGYELGLSAANQICLEVVKLPIITTRLIGQEVSLGFVLWRSSLTQ